MLSLSLLHALLGSAFAPQEVKPDLSPAPVTTAAPVEVTPGQWVAFLALVIALLFVDLVVLHKKGRKRSTRAALLTGATWVAVALAFAGWVWVNLGEQRATEFLTGYVVELTLSFDNLFVFIILFRYFSVPDEQQHRVLFWGILGALVMRAIFILAGVELLERFDWLTYVLGFLLVFTGIKLFREKTPAFDPEKNVVLRLARRLLPVTTADPKGRFFVREGGRTRVTMLFLCLVMVEASDVVFAVDSIPAILGITQDRFVVYTSNIFAILGLRSFFELLALLMRAFRYLNVGLAFVLTFIGAKMLSAAFGVHIDIQISLLVVVGAIGVAIAASLLIPPKPPADESPDPDKSPDPPA